MPRKCCFAVLNYLRLSKKYIGSGQLPEDHCVCQRLSLSILTKIRTWSESTTMLSPGTSQEWFFVFFLIRTLTGTLNRLIPPVTLPFCFAKKCFVVSSTTTTMGSSVKLDLLAKIISAATFHLIGLTKIARIDARFDLPFY